MASGSLGAGTAAPPTTFPVFIDTNLDTHLAMAVSADDTVADLKRQVMIEHALCFPDIGEIAVCAVKVRRRSCFYHLSDAMLVRSAFDGIKGTWYVHMDAASTCLTKNQVRSSENPSRLESGGLEKEPHALETGACKFLDSFAGRTQSCVLNGPSTAENLLQLQPDSGTALPGYCEKPVPCDPPHRTSGVPDDPKCGSSHIENQQVLTSSQFDPIDKEIAAAKNLNLGAEDSRAELCVSPFEIIERSDSEMLKVHNPVSERNGALEAHVPLKENVRDSEQGVGRDEVPSASLVPNKGEKFKKSRDLQIDNSMGETLQPVSVPEKKRKRGKKKEAFQRPAENNSSSDARAGAHGQDASELENANLKELSSKPLNDDCSSPQNLVEMKRKKISLKFQNGVDCEAPDKNGLSAVPLLVSGADDVITSKDTVAGTGVGSLVAIGTDDTVVCSVEIEKDALGEAFGGKKGKKLKKHHTVTAIPPLVEVLENITWNMTPSLHENVTVADAAIGNHQTAEPDSHASSAPQCMSTSSKTVGRMVDSVMGINMDKFDTGKAETEMGASGQAKAYGEKKAKKSRKHRAVSSEGPNPPSVEGPENVTGDTTPLQLLAEVIVSDTNNMTALQHENVTLADDNIGIHQNGEPNPASSTAPQDIGKAAAAETVMESLMATNLNEIAGTEAEAKMDASTQVVASGDKKARKPRRRRGASSRSLNPPSVEEHGNATGDTMTSRYGNFTLGDDSTGIHQFDRTGKVVNTLSKNEELKLTTLDTSNSKNESLGMEKAETGKDRTGTLKLLEASKIIEAGDIKDRKGKKSKKTHSAGTTSHVEDATPLDSDKDFDNKEHGDVTKEVANGLSQAEKRETPETEISNNQLPCLDKEADNASRDEVTLLNTARVSGVEETTEFRDEKGRKKLKKAPASTALGTSEPLMNQHDSGSIDPAPSSHTNNAMGDMQNLDIHHTDENEKEENALPRKTKKMKSGNINLKDPLSGSTSQGKKDTRTKVDTIDCNFEGRHPKANVRDKVSCVDSSMNVANDSRVNFKRFFVPEKEQQLSVDSAEDVASREAPKKSHKERTNKPTRKPNSQSQDVFCSESPSNSRDRPKRRKKTQDSNADAVEIEGPLSKDEQGKHALHGHDNFVAPKRSKSSRAKVSNASGNNTSVHVFAVEGLKENDANQATSGGITDLGDTIYASRLGRHVVSPSNRYRVAVRKVPSKKVGEVLDNSDVEKSLLASSDSIFKHISSESSQDDGEVNDSDATTISHSNDSSTSAYTDGEQEGAHSKPASPKNQLNMDSPGTGASSAYGGMNKEDGCNDIDLSQSTGTKSRSIGMVLRSSSAYRKAKLILSQSRLDDSESQPDVVPDSQAANQS
ncbi:uncharacterized protein LOC131239945 isoform X2 [Magnolia sinica]|uniref:uncharacterized protein LOC131239945 isoform X2 n=1 Tax=Magnolia sinica TaxID=86752 RepID=UPI00265B27BF|nr:uncharacterized protein LOC131239945 isoform X2 [Magnolia sinica]